MDKPLQENITKPVTSQVKGLLYIALAGISWSTTGIFAKNLLINGFSSIEVSFMRLFLGSLLFLIYFLAVNFKLLKIDRKGLILTFFMGVITQGIFNLVFFASVERIGVINGTILLYLAPLFITFFSVLLFKERLTPLKQLGVVLSIIGSILALTGAVFNFKDLSAIGVLLGVASGLGYSLVSVFSKIGLKRYHAKTLIFYSFAFGAAFIFPLVDMGDIATKIHGTKVILSILGLGIFSATVAYIFYFEGISTGLDLSKVGVMSMVELIFAIIFAVLFVSETLNAVKIFGIGLILLAIYLINKKGDSKNE